MRETGAELVVHRFQRDRRRAQPVPAAQFEQRLEWGQQFFRADRQVIRRRGVLPESGGQPGEAHRQRRAITPGPDQYVSVTGFTSEAHLPLPGQVQLFHPAWLCDIEAQHRPGKTGHMVLAALAGELQRVLLGDQAARVADLDPVKAADVGCGSGIPGRFDGDLVASRRQHAFRQGQFQRVPAPAVPTVLTGKRPIDRHHQMVVYRLGRFCRRPHLDSYSGRAGSRVGQVELGCVPGWRRERNPIPGIGRTLISGDDLRVIGQVLLQAQVFPVCIWREIHALARMIFNYANSSGYRPQAIHPGIPLAQPVHVVGGVDALHRPGIEDQAFPCPGLLDPEWLRTAPIDQGQAGQGVIDRQPQSSYFRERELVDARFTGFDLHHSGGLWIWGPCAKTGIGGWLGPLRLTPG